MFSPTSRERQAANKFPYWQHKRKRCVSLGCHNKISIAESDEIFVSEEAIKNKFDVNSAWCDFDVRREEAKEFLLSRGVCKNGFRAFHINKNLLRFWWLALGPLMKSLSRINSMLSCEWCEAVHGSDFDCDSSWPLLTIKPENPKRYDGSRSSHCASQITLKAIDPGTKRA